MDGVGSNSKKPSGLLGLPPRLWGALGVIFSLTGLALYAPAIHSWFSSDDFIHYSTVIEGGLPFVPTHASGGFLRPLVGAGFWLDYHVWGLNPLPPHLVNVLLHIANSLLLVKFAADLQPRSETRQVFAPIAAGFLFLVLGCHGEPVAWISSRGDLTALLFSLLTLVCFYRALQTGGVWPWIASLACLILALLSKESAFSTPLLMILCWVCLRDAKRRTSGIAITACGVVLLGYLYFRKWMLGGFVGGYGTHGHLRFHRDLIAQSLGHFTWRIFFPPLPDEVWQWLPNMEGLLAVLFLVALSLPALFFLTWDKQRNRPLFFCYLAFFLALAPVINVRIYLNNTEGERYLYLASAFAAMGAAFALERLPRPSWRWTGLVLLAATQASLLLPSVGRWHEAANIAQEVVYGLQKTPLETPIILVNKPDACAGALVLRTGLPEALRYFGDHPILRPEINVLFAAGIATGSDRFLVEIASDDAQRVFKLSALNARCEISEEDRSDRIEVLRSVNREVVFRFRDPLRDAVIFYYDSHAIKACPLEITTPRTLP